MQPRKYHLKIILLICIITSSIQTVLGVPYKDDPKLEPFALTQEVIQELTQPDTDSTNGSAFSLRGITITTEKPKWNSIVLSVETDPRLNLWRGRPNDLASSHLGQMKLIVTSVTDKNGDNIHDMSADKPWSSKVTIYNLGEGIFRGSRSIKYKQSAKGEDIRQISGKIMLSLPVDIELYVVNTNDPEAVMPLLETETISNAELKNGIRFQHPDPTPGFRVTIMGFNDEGERINIVSAGSAGSKQDNHWYYFSNEATFDEMLIFIPDEFIDVEIPFTLDIQSE